MTPTASAIVSTSPTRIAVFDSSPPQASRLPAVQKTQHIPLSSSTLSGPQSQDSSWNTTDDWVVSLPQAIIQAGSPNKPITMTKEEKAAEMAKRKEERKQVKALHP